MSLSAWGLALGAGELKSSSSYLGIKIDREQFGLWISPEERLTEVVLGFF